MGIDHERLQEISRLQLVIQIAHCEIVSNKVN